mgnify:CR=1 FL=1
MYEASMSNFQKIPGGPIAYWVTPSAIQSFQNGRAIGTVAETRKGMGTGNNALFVRFWHEVCYHRLQLDCKSRYEAQTCKKKWFPYNDGGPFRKWYGNNESIVNWEDDGREAKANAVIKNNGGHWSRYLVSLDYFFRTGLTWTAISSAKFSARYFPEGFLFSSAGMCLFSDAVDQFLYLGFLNSSVSNYLLTFLSPTLNYGAGEVGRLPFIKIEKTDVLSNTVQDMVLLSRRDWDSFEASWDFQFFPWLNAPLKASTVGNSWQNWQTHCTNQIKRMQ